jgi:hypothetical protein
VVCGIQALKLTIESFVDLPKIALLVTWLQVECHICMMTFNDAKIISLTARYRPCNKQGEAHLDKTSRAALYRVRKQVLIFFENTIYARCIA